MSNVVGDAVRRQNLMLMQRCHDAEAHVERLLAENQRLREKAKRVVKASDKVGIDRDSPTDAYYEWCAAVYALREALAGDAE